MWEWKGPKGCMGTLQEHPAMLGALRVGPAVVNRFCQGRELASIPRGAPLLCNFWSLSSFFCA